MSNFPSFSPESDAAFFCVNWFEGNEEMALAFLGERLATPFPASRRQHYLIKALDAGAKDLDALSRLWPTLQASGFPVKTAISGLAARKILGYARAQPLQSLLGFGAYLGPKEDVREMMREASRNGDPLVAPLVVEHLLQRNRIDAELSNKMMHDEVLDCIEAARIVDAFARSNLPIDEPGLMGNTPLMRACALFKTALVQALLRHGANPNAVNAQGITPLMAAASVGTLSKIGGNMVRALLHAGADVQARDSGGLDARARATNPGVIQALNEALDHVKLHQATPSAPGLRLASRF